MAVRVHSLKYPELDLLGLGVRFHDGWAEVSDEIAQQLAPYASLGVYTAEPLPDGDDAPADTDPGEDLPLSGARRRKQ